jgi:hypothetical protein
VIEKNPALGIEPEDVRPVGMGDSIALAALSSAGKRPYPAMTRYDRSSLAGVPIDGAYVYPLPVAVSS